MLTNLYISNIVLIEKLNLEFGDGLNVLTGETGAGKSILLDALSLALGGRADAGLIRHGFGSATVIAEFDFSRSKDFDLFKKISNENEIDISENIILKRTLDSDGKSRAWVNDIPVSVKTLKQIGDDLVEIHGQFENHSLLNQATHLHTLDEFALKNNGDFYRTLIDNTRIAYNEFHTAEKRLQELEAMLERSIIEREFLEHNVAELSKLAPQIGEENELSDRRASMMNAEKNTAILSDALTAMNPKGNSLDSQIFSVIHILERIRSDPNPYAAQIAKLYEAAAIVSDVSENLTPENTDVENIEGIEERLFAIRAAARKHRIPADELCEKLTQMSAQLNIIENSDTEVKKLKQIVVQKKNAFDIYSAELTSTRIAVSKKLREKILVEFPDLKLGQADFNIEIKTTTPGGNGSDEITFLIKTNPGSPFTPLHKTASGGELARIMLALRVVLTDEKNKRVFVFDEIDTGISGATARAVGERLERLANGGQALVITHSAQVAGLAGRHFKIEKSIAENSTTTNVFELIDDARINEIARIISGAQITTESIATAKTLMKN